MDYVNCAAAQGRSRSPVVARRGVVASSQPLASWAGLSILMAGGNAADAAIATAAALNLVEPMSTGLGGDCFALYYDAVSGQISALNGSGRAPAALSIDLLEKQGLVNHQTHEIADPTHAHTVTVPGACAGWFDLLEKHGSMPMSSVLEPAITLAEEGFPVAPRCANGWTGGARGLLARTVGGRQLTIDGRAPLAGEIFRNPGLARTFRQIAEGGRDAFYRGDIARRIAAAVQQAGGVLSESDLATHRSTWETPISVSYRDMHVWECPPNGQGITVLLALNILKGFDVGSMPITSPDRWHLMIEAMRLAFADSRWFVADPAFNPAPLQALLSDGYAAQRRALIDMSRAAADVLHGTPAAGSDTVYFSTADARGNACSFINSIYHGFGSGIVPEGCGFALQNRGHNFSTHPEHPNALAPGKRPYHTIIPGMITRSDGTLYGPFGVMGGFMQPQGHVQVAMALIDDGCDPQAALDRPRFCIQPVGAGGVVHLEEGVPADIVPELEHRGHRVRANLSGPARGQFGSGQVIRRGANGVWWAGSDLRPDGCAMGF